VVEMIHTATLVHDDILDESMIRRHAATVNAEWGNETAVLMGDYLFTHAFHLAASLETTLACRWIGHATNLVCEGEMQQVNNRGNFELDEEAYFAIIRGKTAELTAVSCRLGAHYAGAPESTIRAMEEYGRDLGVAFQIADDVLDLWGEERATGKSLGTDLEKQKLTLPLIRLLETSDPQAAESIRGLLSEAKPEDRLKIRQLLDHSEALQYAWNQAERHASRAAAALEILPESPCKSVLRTLTHYVVRRSN
jgi:octaprenyl-diphosphate synthase